MKQHKLIQRVMAAILISSLLVGCSTFLPGDTAVTPTVSSTPLPSATPSPRPTKTATPLPAWVTDFADPILAAIADAPPDFEEDFSQAGPGWYLETVNCPDNGCSLSEGVLSVVALPGNTMDDWAQQPLGSCCSGFKGFVIQVDVDPSKLTDENTTAFWYSANTYEGNKFTTNFSWFFELKKDLRWTIFIPPSSLSSASGRLPRSTSLPIIFTLISRDSMLAVYLNDIPVTHMEYDGGHFQPGFDLGAWSAGSTAAHVEYDNVRVWNVDNIPSLP